MLRNENKPVEIFPFGRGPVSWRSKKEIITAQSTVVSE